MGSISCTFKLVAHNPLSKNCSKKSWKVSSITLPNLTEMRQVKLCPVRRRFGYSGEASSPESLEISTFCAIGQEIQIRILKKTKENLEITITVTQHESFSSRLIVTPELHPSRSRNNGITGPVSTKSTQEVSCSVIHPQLNVILNAIVRIH